MCGILGGGGGCMSDVATIWLPSLFPARSNGSCAQSLSAVERHHLQFRNIAECSSKTFTHLFISSDVNVVVTPVCQELCHYSLSRIIWCWAISRIHFRGNSVHINTGRFVLALVQMCATDCGVCGRSGRVESATLDILFLKLLLYSYIYCRGKHVFPFRVFILW